MDFAKIEKLARLMKEQGLNEVYYKDVQGEEIRLEIDSEYRGMLKGDFSNNYFGKLNNDGVFSVNNEKYNQNINHNDNAISKQSSASSLSCNNDLVEDEIGSENINLETISSKMIGTFYSRPSPDEDSFVKVGDNVKKGESIYIIESMKLMNNVKAEYDCEIVEILVEDGEVVEFGQELFKVIKK